MRLVIYDASDRSSRSSRRSFSIFLVLLAATTTTNNDAMPRLKMTRGAARRSQENQSSAEQKGRRCIREETRQVGRTVAKGHNPPETRKTRTSRGKNFRVSVRFFFLLGFGKELTLRDSASRIFGQGNICSSSVEEFP